jgi:EAL domain-containing protein (putative c-di-GMP-specific phosphodiesterase class I)
MSQQLKRANNPIANWLKIFLPHSKIKFYPPQFIIRNPMVTSVKKSFSEGFEVAVIVFNIKNLSELTERVGLEVYLKYNKMLKKAFLDTTKELIPAENILLIHDYNSDGITLILRVDPSRQTLSELDGLTNTVLSDSVTKMASILPGVNTEFNTGYMFVEKKYYSIDEALNKAHQQAVAMAEKKVDSDFNHLLYTMSSIVDSQDIRLLAQPIFDVATQEIRAYEVLTRGPVGTEFESPLSLFSVARQTSLLYDLELIVLEKTLSQITVNKSSQHVFINFTPLTIGNQRFIKDLNRLLTLYPAVSSRQIVIEVTERDSIEEIELFTKNLKKLRLMGFRVAVDDTGAGYASLHTISEIMPDIIKIDRSVIQNIDTNAVKESMLQGLLHIARETGSIVVAEGIESAGEAMVLSKNKVDLAQGYYYARPSKIDKIPMSS